MSLGRVSVRVGFARWVLVWRCERDTPCAWMREAQRAEKGLRAWGGLWGAGKTAGPQAVLIWRKERMGGVGLTGPESCHLPFSFYSSFQTY